MSDDVVASVKGITKALDTGIRFAKRISKSLDTPTAEQTLQIKEAAQSLQKALEGSSQAIGGAYRQSVASCGEPFAKTLVEDQTIQKRFKDLQIDLILQSNECQDFDEDEPDTFNQTHFTNLQEQAQRCAVECVSMINGVRDKLLGELLRKFELEEKAKDDRVQLSSMRQQKALELERKALPKVPAPTLPPAVSAERPTLAVQRPTVEPATPERGQKTLDLERKPVPKAPAPQLPPAIPVERPALSVQPPTVEPAMPKGAWAIESPAEFSLGSPQNPTLASPRLPSREVSPSSKPIHPLPRLITKEIVNHRLSTNEEFLERRRQSRILFHKDFRLSISSIEENRASGGFSDGSLIGSPILGESRSPVSAIDGRTSRLSGSGYDTLMTRQRSQGGASQASRDSKASSILQSPLQRTGSQASQESIFGLRTSPLTPPMSARESGTDQWGNLATTLQLPGFGKGVEPGLEVVSPIDHDNGLILANEGNLLQATPTASIKSIDYAMRHDTSFYKFGGFCDAAKSILRGETGFKLFKRPMGQYNHVLSAQCTSSKCRYEVGWNIVEKDKTLDRSGIYDNSGIRWRQRFVSKCHVKTNDVEEPLYACIFCVDEHKTVEENDATIFFSVGALFRHLARHSQPVRKIPGIEVLYGPQEPTVVDFDIHFTTSIPRSSPFSITQIAAKVATRPSAHAIATYNPKLSSTKFRDPDGNLTLHFASGARIVGITFPERFGGTWCTGYHDGERGSFPASSVILELPNPEDVLMAAQSSLIAYAKWDFKPRDAKDGGWLKFSKGDKISAVGYSFQDQWCWSGQTSRGKWGLFPAAFVGHLQEDTNRGGKLGSSPGSVRNGGLGARIMSIPIGRKKSSRERSGSVLSSASNGSHGMSNNQPGLEVASGYTGLARKEGFRGVA